MQHRTHDAHLPSINQTLELQATMADFHSHMGWGSIPWKNKTLTVKQKQLTQLQMKHDHLFVLELKTTYVHVKKL